MTMIHTMSDAGHPRFGQAWRHDAGHTATVNFGEATLHVDTLENVRELLTAALGAYQALARLEADPALGKVSTSELDTAAIGAGLGCAIACAVDGHVPPRAAAPVTAPEPLDAAAAAAREILESPRCGSCGRLAGMPTSPCSACPDSASSPAAAQ